MKKIIGAILIVIAISVGLTIYTEGADRAYGGIFSGLVPNSPQQPQPERDPAGARLGGQHSDDYGGPAETNYKKLVDRVRDKTERAMRDAEERLERGSSR